MTVGEILVRNGVITSDQLAEVAAGRKSETERIDQALIRSGAVHERQVLEVFSEQFAMPIVELNEADIDPEIPRKVPSKLVHKYGLMPISRNGESIRVATADPYNQYALDDFRASIGMPIDPVLATQSDINKMIKVFYGVGGEVLHEMVAESGGLEIVDEHTVDSDDLDVAMAQEASVIKLVNEILIEAIEQRASDIHFEPFEDDFRVRYRTDGVLHHANVPPEIFRFRNAIVSRIKILSDLNIAEKRLPQDGGFKVKLHNREIDLRISIIPMAFGEGVVLRILDRSSLVLRLPDLGMQGTILEQFHGAIDRPHGIILVTGPTGSGKTTTLYAALNKIVSPELKILTIEDPIEYYLDGVNQVQILPKIGLTFARGLRSFLRHDPDVILVGEIRDQETAEVAINASLTGHLVFSTLHTNDAVTANTRLLDMGVEPFLISSSIEAVLAQRLLRRICKHCKEEWSPEDVEMLPPEFEYKPGEIIHRGRGCRDCRGTGFSGRSGVFELMLMNDELRHLVNNRAPSSELLAAARRNGLRMLRDNGWELVRQGVTTPEEVVRCTKE